MTALPHLGHFDFSSMLGHFDLHRRYVEYLSSFLLARFNSAQVSSAMGTCRDFVDANLLRLLHHFQCVSLVTFLTTAASPALLAQTSCTWLLQAVPTGRLSAVPAVLGQLVAQRLDDCRLLCYSLL